VMLTSFTNLQFRILYFKIENSSPRKTMASPAAPPVPRRSSSGTTLQDAERVAELLRRGAEIGGLNRVLLQKDVREFADMHNVIADECDGDETKVCRVEGARLRRPLEEGGCACM
jgi:hypothetical protein